MNIALADIKNGRTVFNLEELILFQDGGGELTADIKADLIFKRQKADMFSLRGALEARVASNCGRCGVVVSFVVEQGFQYHVLLQEEPLMDAEYECTDEDCEVLYLTESFVDSREILSEQFLLALPVQIICTDTCKGLCDQCGIDLNKKDCRCREQNNSSPFLVLKNL